MKNVDPSSPMFCLTLALFDTDTYADEIVPAFIKLKISYFGHEGIILRSYDIRKQAGDFGILRNRDVRESFLSDLTRLMTTSDYKLISIVIDKERHAKKYVHPDDPYALSLGLALERLADRAAQVGVSKCHIVAEARGTRENNTLAAEHLQLQSQGNNVVAARSFSGLELPLSFVPKRSNLIGHQIADLAAFAAAKHHSPNPGDPRPYAAITPHYFQGGKLSYYSLKVFP